MGFIFAIEPRKLESFKKLAQEITSFSPGIEHDFMYLFYESDILHISAPEYPIQTATLTAVKYIRN